MEAAPGVDRRADDDELGAPLRRHACDVLSEAAGPRADDLPSHRHAVRARDRGRGLEPLLQRGERAVHVRVERQLALDHQRPDDDDARTAVRCEPAGEVERVLRLLAIE